MPSLRLSALPIVALALVAPSAGLAGQLQVEPILLEMTAPAAAGSITLRTDDQAGGTVQTRVMRWTIRDGKEVLEPTTDVVASPPIVQLTPKSEYTVRVVRVTKQPVVGEESYRVLIDQLPNVRAQKARQVNLLIRQIIPVFFRGEQVSPPRVAWSISMIGGRIVLNAVNSGGERLRIASLRLRDRAGHTISFGNGLIGYVLGNSSVQWTAPGQAQGFDITGTVTVTAETDKGPHHATASVQGRQ